MIIGAIIAAVAFTGASYAGKYIEKAAKDEDPRAETKRHNKVIEEEMKKRIFGIS